MAEMLLQSHDCAIHLLPALPAAWQNGRIKGLKARGNFEVEIFWQSGTLSKATLQANIGGPCCIRSVWLLVINVTKSKSSREHTYFTYSFDTVPGQVIKISKKRD